MVNDISNIELSDAQRALLADVAQQLDKPWTDVFSEAIAGYRRTMASDAGNGHETVYDMLKRSGMLGCLKGGPRDLSTNPKHMEGFGEDGH